MQKQGFTLIEMLLYSVTVGFVLFGVIGFLMLSLENRVKNNVIYEVEGQGEYVMRTLTQAIRNAENVTAPSAGSTDTALTLDVFDSVADPTTFSLSGTTLQVTEGVGSPAALTSDRVEVADLVFEHLSNGFDYSSVLISFTLTYSTSLQRREWNYERTFTTTVSLRQ